MILLLSVLILVHEIGHYAAARCFGIRVDKFGFGMPIGPTLWQKKIGDTTFLIHAFLLGGYVAFDEELPKDSPERFETKPVWQRMIVISSGVIANVVCAFVLVLLTAALWHNLPSGKYEVQIKEIVAPKEQSVWESGIAPGDKVYEINGSRIDTKYGLYLYSQTHKSFDNKINEEIVEQNFKRLKSNNHAFKRDEIIPEGITIRLPSRQDEPVLRLTKNMLKGIQMPPADKLTLNEKQTQIRDAIVAKTYYVSDGTVTLNDIACALSDTANPLFIKVERGGKIIELKTIYPDKDGIIGVMIDMKELLVEVTGPVSAVKASFAYLYDETRSMLIVLKQLFTGKIPLKNLHGVVLVTKIGGDMITNSGIFYGLLLTAVISMNLAIINFLPFPALDGGHFMFMTIEHFRGKPIDEKIINAISNIGFALLIVLMVVVVFNDIFVLVTHK